MISIRSNWRGYHELTKPGVQALLFVSCASGMLIGSDFTPPVQVFFFGLIGISFLAASSAVINHFFDQKIDSKMNRTSERPLVVGKISDRQAIIFSIILYLSGSWMLLFYTNFLTWLLTTLTFIFYGFIYTKYLKYMTSQNIVIGGLAGAMPPLLGWSAITNTIEPNALLLVLIIMVWTPHISGPWPFIELKIMLMPKFQCCLFRKEFHSLSNIFFFILSCYWHAQCYLMQSRCSERFISSQL